MTRGHLGRPPVEPLSAIAWARVERGLWDRVDGATLPAAPSTRRVSRGAWLAAPALALAAAAIFVVWLTRDEPPAPVVHAPAPAPEPADRGALPEPEPTRVVTGDSPSSITVGRAHVRLDAETAVVLSRGTSPNAHVERGRAEFAVAGDSSGFEVVAGDAAARVVSESKFTVSRSAETIAVEVYRGTIELRFRGTTSRLGAGETWQSEPDAVDDTPARGERAPARAKPRAKPAASASPQERYERLAALEVSDPAAALAGYLALARGSGRWAELALFAAARLAADRNDPRAGALVDEYLRRFPDGANADDARELRDR